MQSWKTLTREKILDLGKFLTVERHVVELPDGRIISDWPWVITPDYINVVTITDQGKFLCFRQVKYGVQGTSLAPVGGYLETGEQPLAAAQRELLEEAGYVAPDWVHLGDFRVDANRGAGTAHLFLARGAHHAAERQADDLEEQEMLLLSLAEIKEALARGEFKVLAWATNVALALLTL